MFLPIKRSGLRLLAKVINHIEHNPSNFDMDYFFRVVVDDPADADQLCLSSYQSLKTYEQTSCGTTMCIAGLLEMFTEKRSYDRELIPYCRDLLFYKNRVKCDEEKFLFYDWNWAFILNNKIIVSSWTQQEKAICLLKAIIRDKGIKV